MKNKIKKQQQQQQKRQRIKNNNWAKMKDMFRKLNGMGCWTNATIIITTTGNDRVNRTLKPNAQCDYTDNQDDDGRQMRLCWICLCIWILRTESHFIETALIVCNCFASASTHQSWHRYLESAGTCDWRAAPSTNWSFFSLNISE